MTQYKEDTKQIVANELQSQLSTVTELLDAHLESFAKETGQSRAKKSRTDNKITLNIGGTTFTTSLLTLTADQNSFFAGMFNDELSHQEPDADGEHFIDRNPQQFHVILDFLRGYNVEKRIASLDDVQRQILQDDVDFYNIGGMFDLFPALKRKQVVYIKITNLVDIMQIFSSRRMDKYFIVQH